MQPTPHNFTTTVRSRRQIAYRGMISCPNRPTLDTTRVSVMRMCKIVCMLKFKISFYQLGDRLRTTTNLECGHIFTTLSIVYKFWRVIRFALQKHWTRKSVRANGMNDCSGWNDSGNDCSSTTVPPTSTF